MDRALASEAGNLGSSPNGSTIKMAESASCEEAVLVIYLFPANSPLVVVHAGRIKAVFRS
jgi:hypothetical protein